MHFAKFHFEPIAFPADRQYNCLNKRVPKCNLGTRNKTTDFCTQCGAVGIYACPECNEAIRGALLFLGLYDDWQKGQPITKPPGFCHKCGNAYPWTRARIEAAKELISEMDELQEADREALKSTLPDLIRESPKTELAVVRYKKLLKKAADGSKEGLKKILWVIVTESVKRTLFSQ